jgi:hypothetical protein
MHRLTAMPQFWRGKGLTPVPRFVFRLPLLISFFGFRLKGEKTA